MAQVHDRVRLAAGAVLMCLALSSGPAKANPDPSLAAVQTAVRDIRDRIAAQRLSAQQLPELRAPARQARIAQPLR